MFSIKISKYPTKSQNKINTEKMKIATLVYVVAAGRQARDTQLVSDSQKNNAEPRGFEIGAGFNKVLAYEGMNNRTSTYSSTAVARYRSYGCWCQIGNYQGILHGRGTPVDALDEACKAWHQCRACITVDFSGNNETCHFDYIFPDKLGESIDCQINDNECTVSIFINGLSRLLSILINSLRQ